MTRCGIAYLLSSEVWRLKCGPGNKGTNPDVDILSLLEHIPYSVVEWVKPVSHIIFLKYTTQFHETP